MSDILSTHEWAAELLANFQFALVRDALPQVSYRDESGEQHSLQLHPNLEGTSALVSEPVRLNQLTEEGWLKYLSGLKIGDIYNVCLEFTTLNKQHRYIVEATTGGSFDRVMCDSERILTLTDEEQGAIRGVVDVYDIVKRAPSNRWQTKA